MSSDRKDRRQEIQPLPGQGWGPPNPPFFPNRRKPTPDMAASLPPVDYDRLWDAPDPEVPVPMDLAPDAGPARVLQPPPPKREIRLSARAFDSAEEVARRARVPWGATPNGGDREDVPAVNGR